MTGRRGINLAVDPGPAPLHPRDGRAEQRLGPGAQVVVGVLVQVEPERLGVFVRVTDGEPAAARWTSSSCARSRSAAASCGGSWARPGRSYAG